MSDDRVLSVVNSGKESKFEWKIKDFSLSEYYYMSPYFMFEGESWCMDLFSEGKDGYISVWLRRSSTGSPINVEYTVSIKTTAGRKSFERRVRNCFKGYDSCIEIRQWIHRIDFSNRQREFLSSGCLTILLTMKTADSGESETVKFPRCNEVVTLQNWFDHVCLMTNVEAVNAASACTYCKGSIQGDKISFHQKCLERRLVKCPRCDEMVSLQKWFVHKCQIENMIAVSASSKCSCCKESVQRDKISFHQKCLKRRRVKCPTCDELFSLQKWFHHECKDANMKAGSSAVACSCCKGSLHEDRNSFQNDCLNKAAKRPRCDDIDSLQNWRHNTYQMANAKAATSATESAMICHPYKIIQDLKQLLLNQEQTDVVLRVEGKEFPAHKAILAARSPVFASTFRNKIKIKKTSIVNIEDCDPSVFPDFLRFLYCNDLGNFSRENMFGLFTIADKYQCEDLKVKCVCFIKDNLTLKTFCNSLALALLHSEDELLRVTTDFFIENADKILVTVEWQTFVAENPTYSNELFIKYVNSKARSNS